jgi:hypothetical protein
MTERNRRADPSAGTLDALASLRLADLRATVERRLRDASLAHAASDPPQEPPTRPATARRPASAGPCPECTPASRPT